MNPTAKKVFKLTGDYTSSVAAYGKPPKGFRFLKLREETDPKTDWFWVYNGWMRETISGRGICEHHVPFVRRLPEPVAPKTKTLPDIGDKFKSYIKGFTRIPFLESEIRDLKRAIENPKLYCTGVNGLHWSSTTQGSDYWCERYTGEAALTPKDILYLKASVAAYEARLAELVPKPPKEPTAEEFRAEIAALNAKVAELERKIASARVTFS